MSAVDGNGDVEAQFVADEESGVDNPTESKAATTNESSSLISTVNDLGIYQGETLEIKVDNLINNHAIVIFSKSHCPFCLDVKDLLTNKMGAPVHVFEVNVHPDGSAVHQIVKKRTGHPTVPAVFIKGNFIGGCDDVKSLDAREDLEDMIGYLAVHQRVMNAKKLETAHLVKTPRGSAVHPLFWFPNVVNNHVVRLIGVQVCTLSVLAIVFRNKLWGRYLAVALLVDFVTRFVVGSSMSLLGMIATVISSPWKPDFKPGPPKQFASFCGVMFSLVGVTCYFTDHIIPGAVVLAGLAGASGLEGFGNICVGCIFYQLGIRFGLIPDHVYRIYTSSRQEIEDSWDYMNTASNAPRPESVDTDPSSAIALKYKKKTDEWTKDDFHLIRNMQVPYFGMPLALAGLATAFKIASKWTVNNLGTSSYPMYSLQVPDAWYATISIAGAVTYALMLILYGTRLVQYPHKCKTEWDCPLRSPSFGAITITLMLFSFLMYDSIDYNGPFDEGATQRTARVFFWIGSIVHVILTAAKFGEWIGFRLELEHVHPTWMIMPVGLMVAALCAPIIPMFQLTKEDATQTVGNLDTNVLLAQFFFSFAYLMWITLFIITFFKVVTTHNSDNRIRHSIWIWLAAPTIIGLANFSICSSHAIGVANNEDLIPLCNADLANYFFLGLMIFLGLAWATFPHINFFGRDPFGMGYWNECFAIDALAACAALFYATNGLQASETLTYMGLTIACIANGLAFLHTMAALIRRRNVFTPEVKWGPLSFMKLTHEAFRGALPKLRSTLESIDLADSSKGIGNLELFAAHYSQFSIVHEEHARHEDEVIFKTFNDYFHEHARKYNDDHTEDKAKMEEWRVLINGLLDKTIDDPTPTLSRLQKEIPDFLNHFEEHLKGEEDNLQPIGRKHIPLAVQKQISRDAFTITSAKKWEVMIPFIINNLPRHMQRVRYLKVLAWSMPERAQQIGAIVYRNVDAVMWERLRVEVPEIIPRGGYNWRRYY
uniref:Glutaredoxin domain-containing protein n=1 Tax=Helicotheca tamesis TaxID=374047 RepID=A0A7S2I7X6_9STRA|mmetsp:Transcript_6704/g.9046  ORF Transcript_6704/g.9046 Transcript_6704/m.9046 type:complete len:995 (+) Transcript_6704:82-3066(+)